MYTNIEFANMQLVMGKYHNNIAEAARTYTSKGLETLDNWLPELTQKGDDLEENAKHCSTTNTSRHRIIVLKTPPSKCYISTMYVRYTGH
ncbi:hypothetical protein D910_03400 [Dendroctonus ponderosae]